MTIVATAVENHQPKPLPRNESDVSANVARFVKQEIHAPTPSNIPVLVKSDSDGTGKPTDRILSECIDGWLKRIADRTNALIVDVIAKELLHRSGQLPVQFGKQ